MTLCLAASFQAFGAHFLLNFGNNQAAIAGPTFIVAASNDNMQTILDYLASGGNSNVQEPDGTTALYNAVRVMNKEIVDVLLQDNAINVNKKGKFGYSPLHWAVINNDEETLSLLLAKPGIALNITDDSGKTALHLAAERGFAATATELLCSGARTDIADQSGLTALQVAQQRNRKSVIQTLNAFAESRTTGAANNPPAQNQQAQPANHEENPCAICLEELEEGNNNQVTRCGHTFHTNCFRLLPLVGQNTVSCPLCRAHVQRT